MKLNEQSKNELRKEIEEAVKRVPEGQRIELPLDLLDDLIFLKIKDKKGVTVKFPIWTGEFLRKIDLSKLSFEKVNLSVVLESALINFDREKLQKFDLIDDYLETDAFIPVYKEGNFISDLNYDIADNKNNNLIDFSYTNVKIDFNKLYKNYWIIGVNLEGVDLSKSNIMEYQEVRGCNFKDTNLNFSSNYKYMNFYELQGSSFENCNFSNVTIDFSDFLFSFGEEFEDLIINFKNTGLNIIFNVKLNQEELELFHKYNDELQYFIRLDSTHNESQFRVKNVELSSKYDEVLSKKILIVRMRNYIKSGFLDGCYINGKLINSYNDIDLEANEFVNQSLLNQYENMKKDIFETTLESIEEQIKGFKGK